MSLTVLPPTKWILKNIQLITHSRCVLSLHKATSEVELNSVNIYYGRARPQWLLCDEKQSSTSDREGIVLCWSYNNSLSEFGGTQQQSLCQSVSAGWGQFNLCPPECKQSQYNMQPLISLYSSPVIFSDGRNNAEIMGECHKTSYVNHRWHHWYCGNVTPIYYIIIRSGKRHKQ